MGDMQQQGLTASGQSLVEHMMDRGIIIDIDHLSEKSLDKALEITAANRYPVVGSHSGFLDTAKGSQEEKIRKKKTSFSYLQKRRSSRSDTQHLPSK